MPHDPSARRDGAADRLHIGGIELPECFAVCGNELTIEGITVGHLARLFGTPAYIYSAGEIRRSFTSLARALNGFARVFYSIKANPHPAIVESLVAEGAGLEIASLGEYRIARAAGVQAGDILFAGPGKRRHELAAVIAGGIGEVHVESLDEARVLSQCAVEAGRSVYVSIRVNPAGAAQGGAMRMGGKASAFGIDEEALPEIVPAIDALPGLETVGLHVYSGTQILSVATLEAQWRHSLELARRVGSMLGRPLVSLDLGGGLGIPYHSGDGVLHLPDLADLAARLRAEVSRDPLLAHLRIVVEPGRFLVGPCGVYLAGVTLVKHSRGERFIVTDGGMHHHLAASGNLGQIIKRDYPVAPATRMTDDTRESCQIVGPLCTPLDTLARKASMPALSAGDVIAIFQSGAYGLTASPGRFLSHDPPAEVLVRDGQHRLLDPPQTLCRG